MGDGVLLPHINDYAYTVTFSPSSAYIVQLQLDEDLNVINAQEHELSWLQATLVGDHHDDASTATTCRRDNHAPLHPHDVRLHVLTDGPVVQSTSDTARMLLPGNRSSVAGGDTAASGDTSGTAVASISAIGGGARGGGVGGSGVNLPAPIELNAEGIPVPASHLSREARACITFVRCFHRRVTLHHPEHGTANLCYGTSVSGRGLRVKASFHELTLHPSVSKLREWAVGGRRYDDMSIHQWVSRIVNHSVDISEAVESL